MIELIGKRVVVDAFGIQYKGVLVEVTDSEVNLQTETGWVTVPMDAVSDIRAEEGQD